MSRRTSRFNLLIDKGDNLNTLVPTTVMRLLVKGGHHHGRGDALPPQGGQTVKKRVQLLLLRRGHPDMTMLASKMSQAPSQATTTQVLPTPTPAQVIDGPITRSRA